MILRPADENGDILPALSPGAAVKGAPAAAQLVRCSLETLKGDWWEDLGQGNAVVEMLQGIRFTEADLQAFAAYITSYIRRTPGVREISDVTFSAEGRRFFYHCSVVTEEGNTDIDYSV